MLFQTMVGAQVTTIPYRGNAPVLNDLRGKQIDMTCDQATAMTSHIKSRRHQGYAVTTKTRIADLPDLPTADEAGLKGFDLSVWHGVYAPKGLPQPVLDKLAAAVQAVVQDPVFIEKLKGINTTAASKDEATPAGLASSSIRKSTAGRRSSRLPASTPAAGVEGAARRRVERIGKGKAQMVSGMPRPGSGVSTEASRALV
jgi:tripartite-type tricarboxylate transporter receptor subunit TctC